MQIRQHEDLLLVIDVQNDFCPGGALAVGGGDAVVPVINRLSERFDHVVVTQDWHPAGHSSFATSHPGAAPFETIAMPYGPQVLWPDHCVQGTPGADFHAVDARREGFEAVVIEAGCRAIDLAGSLDAAWATMGEAAVARVGEL
jgi:nicotinamidase/pyrazinamidase